MTRYTRLDSTVLAAALATARRHLEQARAVLEPLLVTDLTDDDRARALRAPDAAAEASRKLAEVAVLRPELARAAEYDREAVLEDLQNLDGIAGFDARCRELAQWFQDSRLVWEAEFYAESLELHRLAKARAATDGSIAPLLAPFGALYSGRRRPAKG